MVFRYTALILLTVLLGCSHTSKRSDSQRTPAAWHSCFENLNALVFRKQIEDGTGNVDFHLAGSLDDLEAGYASEGMFSIHGRKSNKDILLNNERVSQLLRDEPFIEDTGVDIDELKVTKLNREQAQTIYNDMVNTPCVRNDGPYQRADVAIGFCFGRAITSHMHALRRGVDPRAMKKIWVVGPMRGDWGHHVAHMIRSDDGSWWVIDNVTGLVKAEQWITSLKGYKNTNKELMFFVTQASRFGPRKNYTYNTVNLFNVVDGQYDIFQKENDYYSGFFKDLFKYLDENPLDEAELFTSP